MSVGGGSPFASKKFGYGLSRLSPLYLAKGLLMKKAEEKEGTRRRTAIRKREEVSSFGREENRHERSVVPSSTISKKEDGLGLDKEAWGGRGGDYDRMTKGGKAGLSQGCPAITT